jgi:hypothetical protein
MAKHANCSRPSYLTALFISRDEKERLVRTQEGNRPHANTKQMINKTTKTERQAGKS